MKTTEKIRELFEAAKGKEFKFNPELTSAECEEYFILVSMKESNAARMAELFERAEVFISGEARYSQNSASRMIARRLLEDFERFQKGEGNG